jgi:hypothetical protein
MKKVEKISIITRASPFPFQYYLHFKSLMLDLILSKIGKQHMDGEWSCSANLLLDMDDKVQARSQFPVSGRFYYDYYLLWRKGGFESE